MLSWISNPSTFSIVLLGGTEKLMLILALIKSGYKGTQPCHNSNGCSVYDL